MVEQIGAKKFEEWLEEDDNRKILVHSTNGCKPCDHLIDELKEREDEFEDLGYSVYFTKDRKVNKTVFKGTDSPFSAFPTVTLIYDNDHTVFYRGYGEDAVDKMLEYIMDEDRVKDNFD